MPVILTDEQYLLWIKDPSTSPYINNYVYMKNGDYYDRKSRKNILSVETLNNPKSLLNKIIINAFSNTSAIRKIVEQIKEYKKKIIPRLYISNDKWKYDKEYIIEHNIVNMDYTEPYFTKRDCKDWVSNHLFYPRTQNTIKQNGYMYLELLYTTLQYDIDISKIEDNLSKSSSSKNKDKDTIKIIDSIRERLKFMKETDELFLRHGIKTFDDLLEAKPTEIAPEEKIAPAKKPKSKNSFNVSSYSSQSIKSLNAAEKKELREMTLIQDEHEKKLYEYELQKKLEKKHQKTLRKNMELQNINTNIFSTFRNFIEALDEDISVNQYRFPGILNGITEQDMIEITSALETYYDQYPNGGNEDLSNNVDNIFRIARRFIVNIYSQLLNPRYRLYTKIEAFSYYNKSYDFDKTMLIDNITSALLHYVDNYNQALELDEKIKKYFRLLVLDVIPYNFVAHGSLNQRGMRDKRKKLNNYDDDYENNYYKILYDNNESGDSNIQYRLPKGEGIINGKILTRKFAAIKTPNIYLYFNDNPAYRIIVEEDNSNNDFTYNECRDWVLMPIINPRTFEPIIIDSPIYNRLLCMTYQYDCYLIPRMITSRGYEIKKALVDVIKNILIHEKKPQQTREELDMYILDRQLHREKGAVKDIPDIVGLKWKDYGVKIPSDRIDITENNFALASVMEIKIRREKIASRSSQDPVAFYVFFTEEELNNLQVSNLTADCFIKVKKHYYIPVVNVNKVTVRPKKTIVRTKYYIADKHYSIVNCMRWVMHPTRDPIIPTQLIVEDSKEYNNIFEQALLFDSNIQPIGITPEGIEFKKKVLKTKNAHFKILKVKNKKPAEKIADETKLEIISKSEICGSINNIYTYTVDKKVDAEYLYFQEKMLEMCYKYLGKKEKCNLSNIYKELNLLFVKKKSSIGRKNFVYYEDSALASIIVDYEKQYKYIKLYNEDAQNTYINNYKNIFKVDINNIWEIDGDLVTSSKGAVDFGGVSREFFTNFFEELFCDEVNTKRPFILPEEKSNTNRYYINPNFEPDEKFRKVINYAQQKIKKEIPDFNTEEDYRKIYYIIGKVLSVTLLNTDIGTPKQFSTYILSRFINQQTNIKNYDILYYYLRDFNNSTSYINMMNEQQKNNIDSCNFSFNDYFIITKASVSNPGGYKLTKENYPKYILQLAKHVVTKNFLFDGVEGSNKNMKGRYISLFGGFNNEIRTTLHNENVSIDMLDKLITNEQLNDAILLEFAEKLKISIIKFVDDDVYSNQVVADLTHVEKEAMNAEMRTYMTNIITTNRIGETQEEHYKFIRRLLKFWTGFNYYDKQAENNENGYKVFYFYGSNVRKLPSSHTCFYQLDFFGFPYDKTTAEEKEDYLYERLIESIKNAPGMDMA